GALEAARWEAFRRYLTDFSRLEEAPVISLDLWDRYLVYAIAFGVAEEVLEQARLHAPPELEQTSSIYWYGNYGYSGGSTQNAFAGITSALSGACVPPPSSSGSGGGGGFSGGGGGGRGGGGGGAGEPHGAAARGRGGADGVRHAGRCRLRRPPRVRRGRLRGPIRPRRGQHPSPSRLSGRATSRHPGSRARRPDLGAGPRTRVSPATGRHRG